ncbi:leucine efflux protein LeuE [Nocardioides yefusunii]|uniref:Leucine efflux protein LeuE n=1 Tax=Nocardioides yefusunii TaxID=2500546 RepID=A0ABW1QV93_9ACTN|nr:leucine efflux protein LeuE [Nocardioides yefusunii]
MFGVIDLPTYLVGLAVVILLPGPNSLYVLATATRAGVRPGFAAAAGVWAGDTVLMTLAAGGAASLLRSSTVLFGIVKYAGAAYLTWLGIGLIRAAITAWRSRRRAGDASDEVQEPAGVGVRGGAAFSKALGISLLNPKAILFFISFFVQFVDPDYAHPWLSFLVLGVMVQAASALYLSVLIISGARVASALVRRRRLTAVATGMAGMVFLAFAVKLGVATAV